MKARIVAAVIALSTGASFRAAADTTYNLEDLDFSWMSSGWSTPCKNATIYTRSTQMRLWNGTAWEQHPRGISTQAESHWFINLGGEGVSFSATVGLDKTSFGDGEEMDSGRCGEHKANFVVYDVIGGTNIVESGLIGTQSAAQTIAADLSGVELIDLAVYPEPGYSGGWQHADWAEPVIVMKGDAEPVTRTADGTNRWTGKGADDKWSTAANWEFGVPGADATIVFDSDATVLLDGSKTVSNIVVNAGATAGFQTTSFWSVYPTLTVQEVNGEGTLVMYKIGLKGNFTNFNPVKINVANLIGERFTDEWGNTQDNWFSGGDGGYVLEVNSKVVLRQLVRVTGDVHFTDEVVLERGEIYLGDNAVIDKLVLDAPLAFGRSAGDNPVDSTGTIKEVVVHGTTYDYSAFADKTWTLSVDGGTVDIGDGSSIGSDGLEIGVLSGGYLRYTVSEIPETGVPAFPQNLTFAGDADLTTVLAIVKNASGDAQKTYAITKQGDVYSLADVGAADTVKWIGGVDNNWFTPGNWIYGAVPADGQSVVFDRSVNMRLTAGNTTASVGTITIADGAVVRFETTEEWGWDNGPVVPFAKITGGGVLQLKHAQLRGAAPEGQVAVIECGGLEILSHANNDSGRSSILDGPAGGAPMFVTADISGAGYLKVWDRIVFGGDNSGFEGEIQCGGSNGYGDADRYFDTPDSFFPNARLFYYRGRIFVNFVEGTASMGNVDIGESWGASLVMKDGADVTLEVAGGKINDSHNGDGFEVWTRDEGADDYLRVTDIDPGTGYTKGCEGLTIKKVGEGTLVYGLTKAHNLVVAEGRVEFTGENSNGDDADVNVTVKAGASIGSPAAFSHENPTWTLGGDVTVRHQFTFEPGAAIKQEYIATTTTDEQTQEEMTTYSMRKLTIAHDVNLANVVFGVTNPQALPPVTEALAGDAAQRFTIFAASSLAGEAKTENDGYSPDGSVKRGGWLAKAKRTPANEVWFRPYVLNAFALILR